MALPYRHSLSSVRKWGGKVDDYPAIHGWFGASKAITADYLHRAPRHHDECILMPETIFSTGRSATLQHVAPIGTPALVR